MIRDLTATLRCGPAQPPVTGESTMKSVLSFAAAALLLSAAPVLAGPQASADPNPETATAAPARTAEPRENNAMATGDPDRQVCKKITYTGSRLGGERICKTARQWAQLQRETRDQVEKNQKPQWRDE
jgi:hypothetical protein